MTHMDRVGVRALQQNASAVLRRVEAGERLEVTDRGRTVALLVPVPNGTAYDRLAAQGRLARAAGDLLALGRPLPLPRRAAPPSARLRRSRARER